MRTKSVALAPTKGRRQPIALKRESLWKMHERARRAWVARVLSVQVIGWVAGGKS
jgi:hypothetical protein